MSLEVDDFIQHCEWNGKSVACSELFTPRLTNHGICYTFNAMPAKDLYTKYEKHNNDYITYSTKILT